MYDVKKKKNNINSKTHARAFSHVIGEDSSEYLVKSVPLCVCVFRLRFMPKIFTMATQ